MAASSLTLDILLNPKVDSASLNVSTSKVTTAVNAMTTAVKAPIAVNMETANAEKQLKVFAETAKSSLGGLGDYAKSTLSVFGGGVLLGGLSGIIGGFEKIISKGKAAINTQEELKLGFRTAGLSIEQAEVALSKNAKATGELSNKYAVTKGEINSATSAFLRFGGSTDNLKQKQENIIGLAAKLGGNYELAARALAKATDPEIEGQLTKFGIKFEKNATEAERQAVITEKLGGALAGLAEKADTPLGKMTKVQNAIGGIASTIGVAFINAVSPIISVIGDVVLPLISSTISILKTGIGAINSFFAENSTAIKATLITVGVAVTGVAAVMYGSLIPALVSSGIAWVQNAALSALGITASREAAAASHAQAIATAEAAAAAETAALVQAEVAVEQSLAAQAQAAAALEVVTLREAELAAIIEVGGADATAATEALLSAELKAGAAFEVAAAKQAEAAASVEAATGLGVEVVAANASVVATGEAAIAADASAFSFGAMWAAATGPVVLVIAGIVAVGAAIYLLYTYVQPVREVFDAIGEIAVVVFEGLWSTIKEVGSVLFSVGEILFDLWITPFKILYGVIQPIISSLFDFVSGLFSFGSAAGSTTTIIEKVQSAFEVLHNAIGFVQASLEGIISGITVFAETATNVINDILHLDFAGAVESAKAGGEKMGNAITAGFNEKMSEIKSSDAAKKFEKDFTAATKGVEETLKSGLEIKAKIKAVDNISDLEASLDDAQAKLKPLEIKIKTGGVESLSAEEKKSFDSLNKSVESVTNKIREIAPEAVTGQKSVVSSNGQLIQSYEINKNKLGEIAVKQKAAYGAESQKEQLKYSANVVSLSAIYDQQKTRLAEVKKALDEANEKGDTKAAEKLKQEFKELSESANKAGKQMSDSFEQGAKSGLLTNDAIITVGKSMGKSAEDSLKLAAGIAKSSDNAAKAVLNVQALGKEFDELKKKTTETEAEASLGAQGTAQAFKKLESDIRAARKLTNEQKNSMTLDEQKKAIAAAEAVAIATFNKSSESTVKSFEEAKALSKQTIDTQIKIQKDARQKEREFDAIAQKTDVARQLADKEKLQKTALDKSLENIEQNRKDEEESVRFGIEFASKSETEKAILIIDINQKYNKQKIEKQIENENALYKIKQGGITSEIDLAKNRDNAILKLNNQIANSDREALHKEQEETGKALVKDHELQLKLNDEALKRNVDNTKTAIDIIDKRKIESSAQEFIRLDDLNAAKISQITAQNQVEINELLNKNTAVLKAEETLKAALAKGDDVLIDAALDAKNTAIRNALDKDAAIVDSNRRTNEAINAQNKQSANDRKAYELSLEGNSAEKERALKLLEIKKTYDAELEAARGNERLKTEAVVKAASARAAAEDKYLQATNVLYRKSIEFQTNLNRQFSDDAIAERKRILKEDTKTFEDSKDALFQSLKAKTLDEKGYYAALNDLQDKQEKVEADSVSFIEQANKVMIETISASAAESQSRVAAVAKKLSDLNKQHSDDVFEQTVIEKKQAEAKAELYDELAANMGVSFVSMVASGENAGKAAQKIAISAAADFLNSMIPVWVAGIFGSFATSGPIGIALAAVTTGVLMGLVQVAKASLSGAHDGFVGITKAGTGRRPSNEDTIPVMVRENESIINPKATAINYGLLEFINSTNKPGHEYYAKMGYDSPEIKILAETHVMHVTQTLILEKEKLYAEVNVLRENYEHDAVQYRENMDALHKQMIIVSTYRDEVSNNKEVVSGLRNIADTVIKENSSLKAQLRLLDRENQLRQEKNQESPKQKKPRVPKKSHNWM